MKGDLGSSDCRVCALLALEDVPVGTRDGGGKCCLICVHGIGASIVFARQKRGVCRVAVHDRSFTRDSNLS